jgi:hypothetical protein
MRQRRGKQNYLWTTAALAFAVLSAVTEELSIMLLRDRAMSSKYPGMERRPALEILKVYHLDDHLLLVADRFPWLSLLHFART